MTYRVTEMYTICYLVLGMGHYAAPDSCQKFVPNATQNHNIASPHHS